MVHMRTWSTFGVRHGIGQRIDYIFISSQHFKVLQHEHLTYSEDFYYPSDHLPVLVNLGHFHGVSTTKTEVFFKSTENYPIL